MDPIIDLAGEANQSDAFYDQCMEERDRDFYDMMYEKWAKQDLQEEDRSDPAYENAKKLAKEMNDPTNPSHYQGSVPKELEHHRVVYVHNLDYHIGCATKYLFRAGKKSSAHLDDLDKEIQDLEKARTYIKMKIDILKEKKYPDNDWR